jgi:hypothetical protein
MPGNPKKCKSAGLGSGAGGWLNAVRVSNIAPEELPVVVYNVEFWSLDVGERELRAAG